MKTDHNMLKEQIQKDVVQAMKDGRKQELLVLRTLLACILNFEKEKHYKISKEKPSLTQEELDEQSKINDDETMTVIAYEVKKRKEAISNFKQGKRDDLVAQEQAQLEILEKYLPEQVSEQEIKAKAGEIIKKLGAQGPKDMGKVIGELMSEFKNRADGGVAAKIVKDLLLNE